MRRSEISFDGIGDAEISISYEEKVKNYLGGIDAFLWAAWPQNAAVTRTSKQAGKALRSQGHHYARVM